MACIWHTIQAHSPLSAISQTPFPIEPRHDLRTHQTWHESKPIWFTWTKFIRQWKAETHILKLPWRRYMYIHTYLFLNSFLLFIWFVVVVVLKTIYFSSDYQPVKLHLAPPTANLWVFVPQDPVSCPRTEMERQSKFFPLGSLFLHSTQTNPFLLAFVMNMFIRPKLTVYLLLFSWALLDRVLEMRWDLRNTSLLSGTHSS